MEITMRRKCTDSLIRWKKSTNRKPLILEGLRQTGKTWLLMDFGNKQYEHTLYINLETDQSVSDYLSTPRDAQEALLFLETYADKPLRPASSLLILDNIQCISGISTLLTSIATDFPQYHIISAARGVVNSSDYPDCDFDILPLPPLDFEEFLWANGIPEQIIALLKKHLMEETPVPEALHRRMRELLLQYAVVGGMPDAVQTFVDTKRMDEVLQIQRDIVRSYEDDMVKYAEKKDKPVIRECFQSIPKQLSKENKKFQYSVVRKGATASKFAGSLQWIEDAGIIARCYNLSITELPLDGNAEPDVFKVYMRDMGLFVAMLEDGTQFDILKGNLFGYKGAIFEGLIADIFSKMGRKLYYFHKDSGLEVDFVIRYKGQCTLVEVKAVSGNTKSAKTILRHPEKYHVNQMIKLGDYNVGRSDQMLTLPLYMSFLLTER